MVVIKVTYSNEIRRFQLPEESNQLFSLLTTAVSDSFGVQDIRISFIDDEGDKCIVGGSDELREAIRFFGNNGSPVKLTIEQVIKSLPSIQPVAPAAAPAAASSAADDEAPACAYEAFVLVDEPADELVVATQPVPAEAEPVEPVSNPEMLSPQPELEPLLPVLLPVVAPEPVVEGPKPVKVQPSAAFVRDVTLPDGSIQACSTKVLKTWEVSNNGQLPWPANCKLVQVRNLKTEIGVTKRDIVLPALLPGESTEVTVELRLPGKRKEGAHQIYFKLVTEDKKAFAGDYSLFADLKVEAPLPSLTKQQFLRAVPTFLAPEGTVDEEVRASLSTLLDAFPGEAVHTNVSCDGCGQFPIKGTRFQCTVCSNFDLCAACEATGAHPRTHPLLKLQRPRELGRSESPFSFGHGRRFGRCLFQNIVNPDAQRGWAARSAEFFNALSTTAATSAAAAAAPAAEPVVEVPVASFGEESKDSGDDVPAAAAASSPEPVKQKRTKGEFVADVNLPDGSEVATGTAFTKKWTIKNCGAGAWPVGTVLMEVTKKPHHVANNSVVPLAQSGETVEVSVDVTEVAPGRMQRVFRLEADGIRFGPRVWLDVIAADAAPASSPVVASASAEVVPSASAPFALPLLSSGASAPVESAPVPAPQSYQPAPPAPFALPLLNAISSMFAPVRASAAAAAAATSLPTPVAAASPIASVPAPVVAPLVVAPGDEFAAQLQILHAIGFSDDSALRPLLSAADGDVQRVVNWLLTGSRQF